MLTKEVLLYLRKFFNLPKSHRRVFICCYILSALTAIIIFLFPLKYYYRFLLYNPTTTIQETEKKNKAISSLIRAMKRVEKLAFWDCTCLNQVVTLKVLSTKLGIDSIVKFTIIDFKSNDAKAHATLVFDDRYEYLALVNNTRPSFDLCIK